MTQTFTPSLTRAEILRKDVVLTGYVVTYECVSGGQFSSWGKAGDTNRIQFPDYDVTKFVSYAPGGWIIRTIDPVYMVDR